MKTILPLLLIFLLSCSEIGIDPDKSTKINYEKELIGTWDGDYVFTKGIQLPHDVEIAFTDSTLLMFFPHTKPSVRENPTSWSFKYVKTTDELKPILRISTTYDWMVTFHSTDSIYIASNNREDFLWLKKK